MPTPKRTPSYIDLFCGCGGASCGFREAGFRCLLAVDWDPAAIDCYNRNLVDDEGKCVGQAADLGAITTHSDVYSFLERHGVEERHCDVLIGGPPCQSFSVVGRTKVRALIESNTDLKYLWETKSHSRSMLFEVYVLFLEALAPRWFLFENVPSIRSHRSFDLIKQRFSNLQQPDGTTLKYTMVPDNYWASDFGVPQKRRRFVMVGFRSDIGIPHWERPTKAVAPNVFEALGDLPPIPNGAQMECITYSGPPQNDYQLRMRANLIGDEQFRLRNHVCRTHNPDDVALFARMHQGARFSDPEVQAAIQEINPNHKLIKYSVDKFQDKLHKLDARRPAWTVTAHLQKDCYKFIHYRDHRTVSVREAARLQSFPDRFRFPAPLGTAFRLIGNAIPPLLAESFARSFLRSDPALWSAEENVRTIIPDALWDRLRAINDILAQPQRRRGKRTELRAVVAAGVLVKVTGYGWETAARQLGVATASSLRRRFTTLQSSGRWERIELEVRRFLAEQSPQTCFNFTDQEESLAAD